MTHHQEVQARSYAQTQTEHFVVGLDQGLRAVREHEFEAPGTVSRSDQYAIHGRTFDLASEYREHMRESGGGLTPAQSRAITYGGNTAVSDAMRRWEEGSL